MAGSIAGRLLAVASLAMLLPALLSAQHESMPGMEHSMPMPPGPLGIPHTRMGSGTSWLPDASPMRAYHWMPGRWSLMLHGDVDLLYDKQFSNRGGQQVASTNWFMFMAMRPIRGGNGLLHLHAMASAEPLTVGARGYPLLLQSGESYQDQPIHDRQHPHDLFVELGVLYEQRVTSRLGVALYAAPVGEPALGPVAFMHRPAAQSDPMASIAHHWEDATHITFGVLTAGIFTRQLKLEGSLFHGREPDAHRYDFDFGALDSWSARLTANPSANWTASASYGFLKSPEDQHPDQSERRYSASILHTTRLGRTGELASSLIWGARKRNRLTHSVVAESNLQLNNRNSVYARTTYVRKTAEDLVVDGAPVSAEYDLYAFSLGAIHELGSYRGASLGLGVRGSLNLVPPALEPGYGTRTPMGLVLYLRLRPAAVSNR